MLDGILTYLHEGCVRIVAPKCLREKLLHHAHSSHLNGGHFSTPKTKKKLKHWAWKNMFKEVNDYVNRCPECLARRPKRTITSLYPMFLRGDAPTRPFQHLAVDLCGPLPLTTKGNRHLLSIVDYFSKYIVAVPIPDTKASTFARAFYLNFVLIHGTPSGLTSDNATNFTARQVEELCEALQILNIYVTPYHSKSNGAIERTFRTFHDLINKYHHTRQTEWDDYVPPAAYTYNCAVHSATEETPFFLATGREPTFPYDNLEKENDSQRNRDQLDMVGTHDILNYKAQLVKRTEEARKAVQQALRQDAEQMKQRYDRKAPNQDFIEGETVSLKRFTIKPGETAKHADKWTGKYRIIDVHPDAPKATIRSTTDPDAKPRTVHFDQIKSWPLPIGEIQPCRRKTDQDIVIPDNTEESMEFENNPETNIVSLPPTQPEQPQEPAPLRGKARQIQRAKLFKEKKANRREQKRLRSDESEKLPPEQQTFKPYTTRFERQTRQPKRYAEFNAVQLQRPPATSSF